MRHLPLPFPFSLTLKWTARGNFFFPFSLDPRFILPHLVLCPSFPPFPPCFRCVAAPSFHNIGFPSPFLLRKREITTSILSSFFFLRGSEERPSLDWLKRPIPRPPPSLPPDSSPPPLSRNTAHSSFFPPRLNYKLIERALAPPPLFPFSLPSAPTKRLLRFEFFYVASNCFFFSFS